MIGRSAPLKTISCASDLMPAFAKEHGGSLDEKQIKSLVAYLLRIYPRELKTRRAITQRNKPALKKPALK